MREGKSGWTIGSRSPQGCLLLLLLFLICLGYPIFLLCQIYPIIFSTLMIRLGIASYLGIPLLITCFLGHFINLPIFRLRGNHHSRQQVKYEIFSFPLWLLKCLYLPLHKTRSQPFNYIYLNVSGGLIPLVLALYQFHRVSPSAILIVTVIVSLISYFLVLVIPGRGIFTRSSNLWLIAIIAALSAMVIVTGGENRFDVSVAFAGAVLGAIIGCDLLHLKDLYLEKAASLSIGGAGFNDGIVKSGLCALILAEWLPVVTTWISAHFQ